MDFFRSILSDDPDPETPNSHHQSDTDPPQIQSPNHHETEFDEDDDSTSYLNSSDDGSAGGGIGGVWSFGDLVKTLTTKSESVFETYRRDLKEFGTGLRKESDLFREVASRAVKELPASIEVGTSAIDGVLKSIAQGKESIFVASDVDESDASDRFGSSDRVRYSRFDVQLNAIRSDVRVYCEDPEDVEEYRKWKLGFVVGDHKEEIEELVGENGALQGMYSKVVPNEVDDATFWFRYFYKVYKLRQQEEMRAKLVKRSLSVDDDEDLSWDVDDEDDEEKEDDEPKQQEQQHKQETERLRSDTSKSQDLDDDRKKESADDEIKTQNSKLVEEDKQITSNVVSVEKNNVEEPKAVEKAESMSKDDQKVDLNVESVSKHDENVDQKVESVSKHDEKVDQKVESVPKHDEKVDPVESGETKDSNVAAKSEQHSLQEDEDLEWDEIEDLGNTDDKNVSHGEITNKADLRKRLSTAVDEEEDLSWDIEDDDDEEPVKPAGNK